ncbi:phage tail-collar fiber domain-containing protein [Serratia fonticola]|uniref:Phage tail protein n=1 Tax=Serratia fonticola TaxID=47917 RepID=A0AAW3WLS7_SERFO|nr:phage tail protein [Serratia fonticola]MBC3211924.1 phage tail protein [Serratia fonticola]NYA13485.1 phage tail protein [Serratia fonticola]NYA33295.1 phage tail protein [Serratia fonticola]
MTAKFFAILTNQGAAKLANATALGTKLDLTHLAVGDGGGTLPTPNPAQTKLKGEKRRAAINMLSVDPANPHQVIAEQVIPENEGGWWIREIGLFDKDGALIAVANCPETYKPQLQEGSGRTQTIRMVLIVSSTEAVTLKIDPSVVLATRDYVDNAITAHAKSRNHPDATTAAKGFVQLSSATNSASEALAATPKAVKSAYDLANNALSKTVTTDQAVAGAVSFAKATTHKDGLTSLGDMVMQAKTAGANLIQRFKDMDGVEQGALYSTSATGQMTLRWGGTNYSLVLKPDGTATFPGAVYSGASRLLNEATALSKTDLNAVRDEGTYFQNASANATVASNYPAAIAGTLEVFNSRAQASSRTGVTQFYYPWNVGNYYYSRVYLALSDTWSEWDIYEARSKSDARYLKIGDYGLGADYRPSLTGYALASDYRINGAFYGNITSMTDTFDASNNHIFNVFGYSNRTYGFQVAFPFGADKMAFRRIQNNGVGGWKEVWHNGNAALDENGFLKSASTAGVSALIRTDFPVGIPQPWPTATAPAGWLKCNGATFDKAKYPLLAAAYPGGRLPDMRGEFIRGADDGRGVDSGRAVLSTQADAVQKFTGKTNGIQHFVPGLTPQGIISQGETVASTTGLTESTGSTGNGVFRINIDASLQIRTATETRPRNIAFNYIVRAA